MAEGKSRTGTGRHRLRRATALVAWLAAGTFGGTAHAAAQTFVALEYEIAPDATGCPDSEEFRAGVARQLHYDPFRPNADRRVSVQIARKEIGFEGRIKWTDADGNWVGDRKLTSRRPDCAEIGASLAFSVAVQIQLLSALAPPTTEPPAPPAPPQEVAPEAPPTVVAPPEPPPAPPPTDRLTVSVGFGPALALYVAPQPTGLARLFVSGRLSQLSIEIAVDAAWPTTRQQADGTGFSLDRFAGGLAGCGHAWALAACVTTTAGVLRAHGSGVDTPATPTGVFSQVGGRLAATGNFLGRYFATAHLDGVIMLSPWTVTINETAAWTTPRVGVLMGVDVGAHL